MENQCFWDSSPQNHAESSGNYVNNSCLNPKRAKFDEMSEVGHVHEHQKLQVSAKPSRKSHLYQQ